MDDPDAFFTHTIVGAPFSVVLGTRLARGQVAALGIEVDLASGRSRLGDAWRDGVLLGRAAGTSGRPRRRPGARGRWLERRALVVGAVGLASLAVAVGILAWGLRWH